MALTKLTALVFCSGMSAMTPRQRVLTAVGLQQPDRVPIDLGGTGATSIDQGAYEDLKAYLGVETATEFIYKRSGVALPAQQILERFQSDTRRIIPQTAHYEVRSVDLDSQTHRNEWGVVMQDIGSGFLVPSVCPFDEHSTPADIEQHPWPDPDDPARVAGLAHSATTLHSGTDYAVILQVPSQVFSFGAAVCGAEAWLIKVATDPLFVETLVATAVDLQLQMAVNMLNAVADHVDIVGCADDFASQRAPMLAPSLYRQIIKPHQRRLLDAIRRHSKAKIWFHTSGNVHDLIPDFIEMGVDILNPVQVSARDMHDSQKLKREFGKDIAFWGAIDTQHVLPFGTPDQVREFVRRSIDDLASGGGYVVSSIQNIPNGTPPANICAMFETAREYGVYR